MPWDTPDNPTGGLVVQALDGGAYVVQISASFRPSPGSAEAAAIQARALQLSTGDFLDVVRRRLTERADMADRYRRLRAEVETGEMTVRAIDRDKNRLEQQKAAKEFFDQPEVGRRLAAANKRLTELHDARLEQTAALDALRATLAQARDQADEQVSSIARSEAVDIVRRLHTHKASLFALRSGDTTVGDFLNELAATHEALRLAGRTEGLIADARRLLDEPATAAA